MRKIRHLLIAFFGVAFLAACSKSSPTPEVHTHSLVKHDGHEATCLVAGNSEYYECSSCHKYFKDAEGKTEVAKDSWIIQPKNHDFDYATPIEKVAPTTTSEGSIAYKCKNCEAETNTFKVARLTNPTLTSGTISWPVVIDDTVDENEANGYKVYEGETLLAELPYDILSYDVMGLDIGSHEIEVVAIFTSESYREGPGGKISVNVTLSDKNGMKPSFDYYGGGAPAGTFNLVNDNGITAMKLSAKGGEYWSFNEYDLSSLYGLGSTSFQAGNYRAEFEIKLGEVKADQCLYFGAYGGGSWFIQYRTPLGVGSCSTTAYTKLTATFTIAADSVGMAEVNFGSLHSSINENSYILIKSAKFIRIGDADVVQASVFPRLNQQVSGWDPQGVIGCFDANTTLNIVTDETSNKTALKVYSETASGTFTIAGNSPVINECGIGIYRMSIDVKLGPSATKVNNIGFRNAATQSGVKHWTTDTVFDLTALSGSTDYVTLTADFEVTDASNTGWSNIDFWVFTHNDEETSIENYVLIGSVMLNKITVSQ